MGARWAISLAALLMLAGGTRAEEAFPVWVGTRLMTVEYRDVTPGLRPELANHEVVALEIAAVKDGTDAREGGNQRLRLTYRRFGGGLGANSWDTDRPETPGGDVTHYVRRMLGVPVEAVVEPRPLKVTYTGLEELWKRYAGDEPEGAHLLKSTQEAYGESRLTQLLALLQTSPIAPDVKVGYHWTRKQLMEIRPGVAVQVEKTLRVIATAGQRSREGATLQPGQVELEQTGALKKELTAEELEKIGMHDLVAKMTIVMESEGTEVREVGTGLLRRAVLDTKGTTETVVKGEEQPTVRESRVRMEVRVEGK